MNCTCTCGCDFALGTYEEWRTKICLFCRCRNEHGGKTAAKTRREQAALLASVELSDVACALAFDNARLLIERDEARALNQRSLFGIAEKVQAKGWTRLWKRAAKYQRGLVQVNFAEAKRAERAEARMKELEAALKKARKWVGCGVLRDYDGSRQLVEDMDAALATPTPPRGEAATCERCAEAHGWNTRTFRQGGDAVVKRCDHSGAPPTSATPEQGREDET